MVACVGSTARGGWLRHGTHPPPVQRCTGICQQTHFKHQPVPHGGLGHTITMVSTGSLVFSLLALLVISIVVIVILRRYLPLRTTPGFYIVPLFFAIWLPSIIVLLVPIDLASSASTDDEATRGIWLPERVILISWRITYWLTFALTWYATAIALRLNYISNMLLAGLFSLFSMNTLTQGTANLRTSFDILFAKMPSFMPSPLVPQ